MVLLYTKPWVEFPAIYKLSMVGHAHSLTLRSWHKNQAFKTIQIYSENEVSMG